MRWLLAFLTLLLLATAPAPAGWAQTPDPSQAIDEAIQRADPSSVIDRETDRAELLRQQQELRDDLRDSMRRALQVLIPALIALGALIVSAGYFGWMWALDRSDRGSGLLALLCGTAGVQLVTQTVIGLAEGDARFHRISGFLISSLTALFAVVLTAWVAERFAPDWRKRVTFGAAAVVIVLVFVTEGADHRIVALFAAAAMIAGAVALFGVRRHHPGALAVLAAAGGLLAGLAAWPAVADVGFYLAMAALMATLFVVQVLALRRRARESEALKARAARLELELIKGRLTPHVLLNTLSSLTEWMASEPKTGARMVEALAAELRALSAVSDRPLISLREELDLCRSHLALMSLQRDQPYRLETEGLDETARVPPAIFHTLIENALTHNRYPDGATFSLRRKDGAYQFHAPAGDAVEAKGDGRGTAYVEARLAEAFGERWSLSAGAAAGGGWTTLITVPA